jgi:hypothetical protein
VVEKTAACRRNFMWLIENHFDAHHYSTRLVMGKAANAHVARDIHPIDAVQADATLRLGIE